MKTEKYAKTKSCVVSTTPYYLNSQTSWSRSKSPFYTAHGSALTWPLECGKLFLNVSKPRFQILPSHFHAQLRGIPSIGANSIRIKIIFVKQTGVLCSELRLRIASPAKGENAAQRWREDEFIVQLAVAYWPVPW